MPSDAPNLSCDDRAHCKLQRRRRHDVILRNVVTKKRLCSLSEKADPSLPLRMTATEHYATRCSSEVARKRVTFFVLYRENSPFEKSDRGRSEFEFSGCHRLEFF